MSPKVKNNVFKFEEASKDGQDLLERRYILHEIDNRLETFDPEDGANISAWL